jgi:alanine-glyoxylate transaminase / serine-glyoxylate transaminase / serine-pyruvate transaminase
MTYQPGRHFLQVPGPTNSPLAVLQALALPTIDHRGPEFAQLGREVLASTRSIFRTEQPVIIYAASATGAWEAAFVNTLSPGDRVLMYETGQFSALWHRVAQRLGLQVEYLSGDWRSGVDAARIGAQLAEDREHRIRAVAVVHNETATGVLSDVAAVRAAMDAAHHPALLLVDAVSSLGAVDYRHDEWGVDVTISGSQKGLMLPPGLAFTAMSRKALAASRSARLPRAYWDWQEMLSANESGFFPFTPNTNLLQALRVAIRLLHEEGLEEVFARHRRAAEATRRCVQRWGLEVQCRVPQEYSPVVTAVRVPEGSSADRLRATILESSNLSLGAGLGKLADRVFRIGHLGDFNDLILIGTLAGVEMGLQSAGIAHQEGGVQAAMQHLQRTRRAPAGRGRPSDAAHPEAVTAGPGPV